MTDNITVRPALLIERKQGYFVIPVFSYIFSQTGVHMGSTDHTVDETDITMNTTGVVDNPYSWNGASQIRAQVCFNSPNNFVLTELPEKPDDVNYCPCIRYRIGEEVFRYKLWEDVGEILGVPLYNGEVIKKNFVIELWTVESTNEITNTEAFNLISSIQQITEEASETSYEVATGTMFDSMLNIEEDIVLDTTNLLYWYSTETRRITVDAIGQVTAADVYQGISDPFVVNGPPVISQDDTLTSYYFPKFDASKNLTNGSAAPGLLWIALIKVPSDTAAGTILEAENFDIAWDGSKITVTANGYPWQLDRTDDWMLIQATLTVSATTVTQILFTATDLSGLFLDSFVFTDPVPLISTGTQVAFKSGFVGDFMAFDAEITLTDYYKKLRRNYGFFDLPLTFDPSSAWDDND